MHKILVIGSTGNVGRALVGEAYPARRTRSRRDAKSFAIESAGWSRAASRSTLNSKATVQVLTELCGFSAENIKQARGPCLPQEPTGYCRKSSRSKASLW